MQSITNANFGPLIAYLVPGATALFGISEFFPALRSWFATTPADAPTIGGFLYLTIASLACGMVVTAIRWAVVDTFHRLTGLPPPVLDFSKLGANVEAFNLLIEIHYRHYQAYSNELIALAIAYVCYRVRHGFLPLGSLDAGFVFLEAIFLITSRDTLSKYFSRTKQLLSTPGESLRTPRPLRHCRWLRGFRFVVNQIRQLAPQRGTQLVNGCQSGVVRRTRGE